MSKSPAPLSRENCKAISSGRSSGTVCKDSDELIERAEL